MISRKWLAPGVLCLAVMTSGAMAADPPPAPQVVVQAPIPPPPPAFSWTGPYVGVHGGIFVDPGFTFGNWRAGLQAGYNALFGRAVLGAEVAVAAEIFPGPTFTYDAIFAGKAGFLAGDRVLIFAELGIGVPGPAWIAGGGVEVAVGEAVSVFGKALALGGLGGGGFYGTLVHVGLNWHPR